MSKELDHQRANLDQLRRRVHEVSSKLVRQSLGIKDNQGYREETFEQGEWVLPFAEQPIFICFLGSPHPRKIYFLGYAAEGAVTPRHSHIMDEHIHVLSGTLRYKVDGNKDRILKADTGPGLAPAKQMHQIECVEEAVYIKSYRIKYPGQRHETTEE